MAGIGEDGHDNHDTSPPLYPGVSLVAALAAVAVLVGPATAHKTPVTPQQLEAYNEVFMDEVRRATSCSMVMTRPQKRWGSSSPGREWPARCAIRWPPTPIHSIPEVPGAA